MDTENWATFTLRRIREQRPESQFRIEMERLSREDVTQAARDKLHKQRAR